MTTSRVEAFSDAFLAILMWLVPDRRIERRVLPTFAAMTCGVALLGCGERPREIHVVANDYALLAPESVPAGITRFTLENRGRVVHELVLGLLQRGKGAGDIAKAAQASVRLRDLPEHYLDGPPFSAQFAWPGATSRARVTVTLEAGREYALFCTLRDSATAPQHAALGMLRVLRVE